MSALRQSQPVVPAIIPQDFSHLEHSLERVSFAHEVHIDVVDGLFVQSISWPYEPVGDPTAGTHVWQSWTVEVDLMVDKPIDAAVSWVAAGAQMLVFHVEAISVPALENFCSTHDGVSIGISALNDTPWDTLEPYLAVADYVQVMGIATIGAQGATFDERVLERIEKVQKEYPDLMISVDGSVNHTTITQLKEAGADRFIVGSAIMGAPDPAIAYHTLHTLVRPQS